jgi:hypothetical protein
VSREEECRVGDREGELDSNWEEEDERSWLVEGSKEFGRRGPLDML